MASIQQSVRDPGVQDPRTVSVPLVIGIILMPYIFAWFLLRQGYSKQARIASFGWLGLILLMPVIMSAGASSSNTGRPNVNVDPNRVGKDRAAYLAKQVVATALKDPSSAEFGNVWGMSATVACGFVNGNNSFGAMTGQSRFIVNDGRVSFEDGDRAFAKKWNSACVDKPAVPAPTGAGGLRWGARPPSILKLSAPPTDDGLATYVPRGEPDPLEGIDVAEADYSFDHERLYAANFYIDGEQSRDAILTKFFKKYGTPQEYDANMSSYSWKWQDKHILVSINFDAKHSRTTVTFSRE